MDGVSGSQSQVRCKLDGFIHQFVRPRTEAETRIGLDRGESFLIQMLASPTITRSREHH